MPAYAWLVHFPDDAAQLGSHRELPKRGDEIIPGWTVTDYKVSKRQSTRDQVDVWVTAKGPRQDGPPRKGDAE